MKLRGLQPIFFLFILNASVIGQINSVSIGAGIGLGELKGNSTSVTSLGLNLFFDFVPWFSDELTFRTGFTYSQKLEYFLPENRQQRYYPFIKSFSLKGIYRVDLTHLFYIEQGAGFIYLNDRTFGDVNEWEPGAAFNLMGGIDFSKSKFDGIRLGIGLDYGITFTKTTASYFLIYFQIQKTL